MIAIACRENLLLLANAYAKATGASLSAVSKQFYGKSEFLREFKIGIRSVSIDKLDEMVSAFAKVWPSGIPWPPMRAPLFVRPRPEPRQKKRARGKASPENGAAA